MQRFWSKVKLSTASDCWLWIGSTKECGYGQFKFKGKPTPSHRMAYELVKGPVPEGLVVCHSCDVRACCNPDHLWVGTQAENLQDAKAKGRVSNVTPDKGENHKLSKLSNQDRAEIITLKAEGRSYRGLARLFSVSSTTIHEICNGKSYKYREL
jgi:hypothetical protein